MLTKNPSGRYEKYVLRYSRIFILNDISQKLQEDWMIYAPLRLKWQFLAHIPDTYIGALSSWDMKVLAGMLRRFIEGMPAVDEGWFLR